MTRSLDVVAALTQVSREGATPQELDSTLRSLVSLARSSAPGIDHVGIVTRTGRRAPDLVAATDELVGELVLLQVALGEGPCLHVLDEETRLRLAPLHTETRWPAYVARAGHLGVRAEVVVRFEIDAATTGVMLMVSSETETLSEEVEQVAELVGAHAGLTMAHVRRIEHLDNALQSRTVIGTALGMVMQRLDLDEQTAFSYLARISASSETKLRDVATSLVEQHHERLLTRRGGADEAEPA